jgi:hypothetical protein
MGSDCKMFPFSGMKSNESFVRIGETIFTRWRSRVPGNHKSGRRVCATSDGMDTQTCTGTGSVYSRTDIQAQLRTRGGLKNAYIFCVFLQYAIYIDVGRSRGSNTVGKLFICTHKYIVNTLEEFPVKETKSEYVCGIFSPYPAIGGSYRMHLDTN